MLQVIDIKNTVLNLLEYIYEDSSSEGPENTKFLYKLFYGKKDGNFDFYQQAKSIFLRNGRSPRRVNVVLEYPKDKTSMPCYVIKEPSRRNGPFNTIGKLTGQYDPSGVMLSRDSKQADFEILCFSDNILESILMAETLYALLLGSYSILAQQYDQISFGMKEIMMESNLIPIPIFIRSVDMSVVYTENIAELSIDEGLLGKVIFEDAGLEATLLTENG